MSVFMVPALLPTDAEEYAAWPTLGDDLFRWQLDHLVYGPGDLKGTPLSDHPPDGEYVALLRRMYQVHPLPEDVQARATALRKFKAGEVWTPDHPTAGRRRFKRVALSVRKGTAKTEKAAWIAAGELHPEAPVRCIGWTLDGGEYIPVGGGVQDPYVPMVAFTEEQSEELAYGALKVILEESDLADDFDIGWERILVLDKRGRPAGKAVALASAPNSRDGARTTFQHFDETHRMVLERLKAAHQTMQANLPKRRKADAWSLETTTTFAPGEGSVAEGTHEYAQLIDARKIEDARLFYFHRQAGDHHKLTKEDGSPDPVALRAAVEEASGPAAAWSDLDSIVALYLDPQTDRRYWRRVWLNQPVAPEGKAFAVDSLKVDRDAGLPPDGALVVAGFDGARTRDSTALVVCDVATGYQCLVGLWERPSNVDTWEVPVDEVNAAVAELFDRFDVWRLYADPYYWQTQVAEWAGLYGEARGSGRRARGVFEWPTNVQKRMALSLQAYEVALRTGEARIGGATPDLADAFVRHLGNAHKTELKLFDDDGKPLWTIRKERPDSPFKIDAAMAGDLAWEARRDAVAAGVTRRRSRVPASVL